LLSILILWHIAAEESIKNKKNHLLQLFCYWVFLSLVLPKSATILRMYFADHFLFGILYAVMVLALAAGFIYCAWRLFGNGPKNKKFIITSLIYSQFLWALISISLFVFFVGATIYLLPKTCPRPSQNFIYLYMEPQGSQQLFLYDLKKDAPMPISVSEAETVVIGFKIENAFFNDGLDKYGCFSARVGLQTPGYNSFYRKSIWSGFPAIRLAGWITSK
jgi:hypothetical protein